MKRNSQSHKGQNGVVAVIGGSLHMHGAPIFSALAAEATGVDLVYPCVPDCHKEVTKAASNNFIVTPFRGDDLSKSDVSAIEEILSGCDSAVMGPGLATDDSAQDALQSLVRSATIPLVLDASALQSWTFEAVSETARSGKVTGRAGVQQEKIKDSKREVVLTPHLGELSRMQGQILTKKTVDELQDLICTISGARKVTLVLKGEMDLIGGPDGTCQRIKGGNAGLTVGGTGDTLAGLIAGLMAQKVPPFEAAVIAATIVKRAATVLFHEKGYAFTAMDVIGQISHLLHTYEG
jgi:NAD(P)H-hydrate epimerase